MTAIHQSHPTRLAEVDRHLALVSQPDEYLDGICVQAARAFDVPMATVSFVHDDEVIFVGRHGVDLPGASAAPGLFASAIADTKAYVVPDAPAHPIASNIRW